MIFSECNYEIWSLACREGGGTYLRQSFIWETLQTMRTNTVIIVIVIIIINAL